MTESPGPQAGELAPDFNAPADGGKTVSLAGLKGKKVVLYFYPKDDTSGCTREALDFTAMGQEFEGTGVSVIGVSKDSVMKHDKFIAKHGLGVTLVSDEDGDICDRFGTWVEKSMYGRKYMGIERATFLIAETGHIHRVWRKVKVPGHAEEVLAAARTL